MQRLSGELAASTRQLELAGADLQGERDRVAGIKALLERKVGRALSMGSPTHRVHTRPHAHQINLVTVICMSCWEQSVGSQRRAWTCCCHAPPPRAPQRAKKRSWKAACGTADSEIQGLHGRLLAREEQIEALGKRVENLEAEVGLSAGTLCVLLGALVIAFDSLRPIRCILLS